MLLVSLKEINEKNLLKHINDINNAMKDTNSKYEHVKKESKDHNKKIIELQKEKKSVTTRWIRATSQIKRDDNLKSK